jgi:hypothetical protein
MKTTQFLFLHNFPNITLTSILRPRSEISTIILSLLDFARRAASPPEYYITDPTKLHFNIELHKFVSVENHLLIGGRQKVFLGPLASTLLAQKKPGTSGLG